MQNKSRKGQETLNTDDTSPSRIQMEEATTRASAMVYRTDRRPGSVFNLIMDSVASCTQQSRDNGGLTQYAELTDNTDRESERAGERERERRGEARESERERERERRERESREREERREERERERESERARERESERERERARESERARERESERARERREREREREREGDCFHGNS